MNSPEDYARLGGALHFLVLVASALTPRVLNWKEQLAGLHPFLRQLFWVYGAFIVLTIIGFGVISIACAQELTNGTPLGRGFCWFVAAFWMARLAVQFFVFDARPFLTNWFYKAGYHGLTVLFTVILAIYVWLSLR